MNTTGLILSLFLLAATIAAMVFGETQRERQTRLIVRDEVQRMECVCK